MANGMESESGKADEVENLLWSPTEQSENLLELLLGNRYITKDHYNTLKKQFKEEWKMEAKYQQCPEGTYILKNDEDPAVETFINYLEKDFHPSQAYSVDIIEKEAIQRELNVNSLLWFYQKHIKTLLSHGWKRKIISDGDKFKQLLGEMKELLQADAEWLDPKYEKVCKLHKFAVLQILHHKEGRHLKAAALLKILKKGDEIAPEWNELREDEEMLIFMNGLEQMMPIDDCEADGMAKHLVHFLASLQKMKKIHSYYLDDSIRKSERLRHYFCQSEDGKYKVNLAELIGIELLLDIEVQHPEVLKIEAIHLEGLKLFYEKFLSARKRNDIEAIKAEQRLVVSFTMRRINKVAKVGAAGKGPHKAVLLHKQRWLKKVIFENPKQLVTAKTICKMYKFIEMAAPVYKNPVMSMPTRNASFGVYNFLNWQGNECDKKAVQEEFWVEQRKVFAEDHNEFAKDYFFELYSLVNKNGRRTRMEDLIPGFRENPLFLVQNLFNDLSRVFNHFLDAVNSEDEETFLLNKLGFDYLIWTRRVEDELSDETNIGGQIFGEVCQEKTLFVAGKYDEIFDKESLDDLKKMENWFVKTYSGLDYMLEKMRGEKIDESDKESRKGEVRKWFKNILEGKDTEWNKYFNQHKKDIVEKFKRGIQEKNAKFILDRLENIAGDEKEDSKDIQKNAIILLGIDAAKQFLAKLNLEFVEGIEDKKISTKTGRDRRGSHFRKSVGNKEEGNGKKHLEKVKTHVEQVFKFDEEAEEENKNEEEASKSSHSAYKMRKGRIWLNYDEEWQEEAMDELDDSWTRVKKQRSLEKQRKGKTFAEGSPNKSPQFGRHSPRSKLTLGESLSPKQLDRLLSLKSSTSAKSSKSVQENKLTPNKFLDDNFLMEYKKEGNESDEKNSLLEIGNLVNKIEHSFLETVNEKEKDGETNESEKSWLFASLRGKWEALKNGELLKPLINPSELKTNLEKLQKELKKATKTDPDKDEQSGMTEMEKRERAAANMLEEILDETGFAKMTTNSDERGKTKLYETNPLELRILQRSSDVKTAVNTLQRIILNYWITKSIYETGKKFFLISGSYLYNAHSVNSDIDSIVLFPYQPRKTAYPDREAEIIDMSEHLFFDGNLKCDYRRKKCYSLDNPQQQQQPHSLFCKLCSIGATFLQKIRAHVPLIKAVFKKVEFDIIFIPIPTYTLGSVRKNEDLADLEAIDHIIEMYIREHKLLLNTNKNDIRKKMLLALSGYRANLRINQILSESGQTDNFRLILLALKLWSKKHFIYSAQFGYLSGSILAVMACQLVTQNPTASIPALLEHFFQKYSKWNGHPIVTLEDLNEEGGNVAIVKKEDRMKTREEIKREVDWKGETERRERGLSFFTYEYYWLQDYGNLAWPVITPGFPTQNAAFNINKSTVEIIRSEMEKGLQKLNQVRKSINSHDQSLMAIKNEWKLWLDGGKFHEKYDHFLTIVCTYAPKSVHGEAFCEHVQTRIRLQLLFSLGEIGQQLNLLYRVKPEKVANGEVCMPNKSGWKTKGVKNGWLCTIWLVGIVKATDHKADGEDIEEFGGAEMAKAKAHFKQTIVDDFNRKNPNIKEDFALTTELLRGTEIEEQGWYKEEERMKEQWPVVGSN